MSARDLKTHALPGLLAGSRGGLALDHAGVATPLQALALTAQALRFDRPAGPAAFLVEVPVTDTRTIVPDTLRRPLIRLLTGKAQGLAPNNILPDAMARALSARRLRLHPFDLPVLETFVQARAEVLGAEAAAFVQRKAAPAERRGYFDADALDDSNWMLATPAARQAYISALRHQDADRARGLVEAVWTAEPADIRVRLLGAMRDGLGPEDAPFLASLDKDRAPRVRELAQRYLARLPGHAGDHPALQAVLGRIKSKQTGFLTKRTTLALELPATVKPGTAGPWLVEAFSGIGLDELGRATGVELASLPAAAEKDDHLLLALAVMATHDRHFDVLKAVVDLLPDAWEQLIRAGFIDLDDYSVDDRVRWAQTIVRPLTWGQDATLWSLIKLPGQLDGPAPEALMRDLMKARPWLAQIKDDAKLTTDMIDAMAALCPPGLRGDLRDQIKPLDPVKTARSLLCLDILDALEATHV